MLKGIIFDFDGVIAQSVQVKTDAFSTLYMPYGNDIIKKVVEHHTANGGLSRFEKIKYYHESFLNKPISKKEISDLADQFSKLVVEKVVSAPYVPGALEFINKSYSRYKLFISTGTPTNEIKKILIDRKISKYFTDVFGSPDKKNIHIKKIESSYNFDSNELIFYGDSTSDLNAAKKENINFILVKNKHNKKLASKFDGKFISDFNELL